MKYLLLHVFIKINYLCTYTQFYVYIYIYIYTYISIFVYLYLNLNIYIFLSPWVKPQLRTSPMALRQAEAAVTRADPAVATPGTVAVVVAVAAADRGRASVGRRFGWVKSRHTRDGKNGGNWDFWQFSKKNGRFITEIGRMVELMQ